MSGSNTEFFADWAESHKDQVPAMRLLLSAYEKERVAQRKAEAEMAEIERRAADEVNAIRRDVVAQFSKLPNFWVQALLNHQEVAEEISKEDEEVLEFLADIRVEHLTADEAAKLKGGRCVQGYRIIFEFNDNKLLSDKQLVKTIGYAYEEEGFGDLVVDVAGGCDIHWKGDDFVAKAEKEDRDTFFHFFTSVTDEETTNFVEELITAKEDGEEKDIPVKAKWRHIEDHVNLAERISERVVPHAAHFFTGEASGWEFPGSEFEDVDSDDDEDDE